MNMILEKLNIRLHQLYNLLKFIRNQIDIEALQLNRNNLFEILAKIRHENYQHCLSNLTIFTMKILFLNSF